MKSRFFSTLLVAFAVLSLFALHAAEKSRSSTNAPLGTWQLVFTKYGNATDFTNYPDTSKRIKLITATHFTWLEVENFNKMVRSSAGGSYKFNAGEYTETIEFAGEGMEGFIGKPQKFTIKIDGDTLHQSGVLSNGLKIEEKWTRVK